MNTLPWDSYCRVSTDNQEHDGTSLDTQYAACLKYCKEKGYDSAFHLSETYSGLSLDRPKLNELLDLVRNRQIAGVLVYNLDRLSRDPAHSVILRAELEKNLVSLESVTEVIDKSEIGNLINYIRGYASKDEAIKIRERTMRGKQAKAERGELPQGTGVGIYGYDWNSKDKKRETNPCEAEIVRELFERVASGEALISVARGLNNRRIRTKGTKIDDGNRKFWHSLTIRRMIRNRGYIGDTRWRDTVLPNITPAIVSEDIFHAANAQLDKPKIRTGRPKHEYLLRNHAFCAICGKPLVGHCLNKKYRYYQCSNARPYENCGRKCPALYIRADDLEELVWSKTRDVLSDPHLILKDLANANSMADLDLMNSEIKKMEQNLRKYEQRRSNLLNAMELGEFEKDEVLDRLNNIKRLRHEDEIRLNDLQKTRQHLSGLASAEVKLNQIYDRLTENLENSSPEIKALAYDALDIKVFAKGTECVEIQGVIPLQLPTTAQTSA
jgi:site-specific DNA recombinase